MFPTRISKTGELSVPTKQFYIYGTESDIFNVGLRPGLLGIGAEYMVHVYAVNDRTLKRVRVLVNGETEQINEFYQQILSKDPRVFKKSGAIKVSDLKRYSGVEPNWDGYTLNFMAGQMYHGFNSASELLGNIDVKLDGFGKRFDNIGASLDEIKKRFDD